MAAMQSGEPERPEAPEGAPGPPPAVPPPPAWPPPPPGWAPVPQPGWAPPPAGWGGAPPPLGYPSPYPPPPPPWGATPATAGWNAAGTPRPTGFGRFRPMGIGELLDAAFALYRRNLLLLVAITAVVQVPFAVLNLVVFQVLGVGADLDTVGSPGFLGTPGNPNSTLSDAQISAVKGLLVYLGLVVVVQMLVVLPLSLAAMSRAVSDRYLDRPASLGSSYAAALRRGGALLGAILLLILLVVGVTAAMVAGIAVSALAGPFGILPAIGFGAAWLVSLPLLAVRSTVFAQAIVVEGLGSAAGLRRSWRLTRGFFWRTFAILLVVFILQTVVGSVLQIPVGLLLSGARTGTQQLVSQGISAVTSVVVSPLSLIALTLVYYDLRIRKEAFDIEMLAASL
jgi:hypothetical protein